MTFEKAAEYLDRLGVEYNRNYDYGKQGTEERHRFEIRTFSNLHLPFTAEEWCGLCMADGEDNIAGCCGTTSAAQSVINSVFREGGWIDGNELTEIGELMANHDENPDSAYNFAALAEPVEDAVQHAWDRWGEINPWEKLALVYHITKGLFEPAVPRAKGKHLSDLDAAISTLAEGLRYLSYERVFRAFTPDDEEGKPDTQGIAHKTLILAKLLPALKTVNEEIHTLNPGPFEGFALIDKETAPDAVAENGKGFCLYQTQEEVDYILNLWREQEKEYEEQRERVKPIDERIGVRRIRVSVEKGLEFLD